MASGFAPAYAWQLAETSGYSFTLEGYSRVDAVAFNSINTLDRANKDDSSAYLGLDYSLALRAAPKADGAGWLSAYLKVERNGPYDYDAPVWIHNTLMPSGPIRGYRNAELLPGVEEFWVDAALPHALGVKAGLFAYQVGHGFAVNGAYENYGVSVYQAWDGFEWRAHYAVPDAVYKNPLGPRVRQEEEQDIGHQSGAAHFFAADAALRDPGGFIQGYAAVLADQTSPEKRSNLFSAPVKDDILGTLGVAGQRALGALTLKAEGAHNIGKAYSADEEYEDIAHAGYLAYAGAEYVAGRWTPSFQVLVCSGNKTGPAAAASGAQTLDTGRNRAFSSVSPSNTNLSDSISSSNADMLPIVAMGGGYGLNYGVSRPGTFSAGDFENLIMPSLGAECRLNGRLTVGVYGYYLRSFEPGVGMLDGEPRRLQGELGSECDVFIDYTVRTGVVVSFLGGYFIPGRYYKEMRDDSSGSLLSPFVRGDGEADPAYQLEVAVEIKF